jgi:hypothetical protein
VATPTTPVTPPPAVTEVFSRPGTASGQGARPARYHSNSRNVSQISLPGSSKNQIIHRSASESSLRHPRPLRRIPSASSLTQHYQPASLKQPQRLVHHQRSISASATMYPQYPNAAVVAAHTQYGRLVGQRIDYNTALLRNSSKAFQAPSAWSAIHPPTQSFRHARSATNLRALASANNSTASFATLRQLPTVQNPYLSHLQHRRARTVGSASSYSSRSANPYQQPKYAQSWNGGYTNQRTMTFAASRSASPAQPGSSLHRKTSSHSSSGSASGFGKGSLTSEVLAEVDEEGLAGTPATSVSVSRSASPPRDPAAQSLSASRVRERSTSRSRSPAQGPVSRGAGWPVQSTGRVSPEGEIRKLRKVRSDADIADRPGGLKRKESTEGSRKGKGRGKQVVHF